MRKRDLATRVLKYHIRQKGATLLLGAFFLLGALLGTQVTDSAERRNDSFWRRC